MKFKNFEQTASDYFNSGFSCAESVLKSVVEDFSGVSSPAIPRAASVFGGGIGGTKEELCGALAGGMIALGILYGRMEPGVDVQKAKDIASELRTRFIDRYGSTRCGTILEKFDPQENSMKCRELTAKTTGMLLELLQEVGLINQ